jgi:hypothetical protein
MVKFERPLAIEMNRADIPTRVGMCEKKLERRSVRLCMSSEEVPTPRIHPRQAQWKEDAYSAVAKPGFVHGNGSALKVAHSAELRGQGAKSHEASPNL